ncbi:Adducin-related protein 1 [Aphelenchoides besseyi]|nr:Adducin-related protein 1 [Aphelenchoides besseyi]
MNWGTFIYWMRIMCSRYGRSCRSMSQPPPRARSAGSMPRKGMDELRREVSCMSDITKPAGIVADLSEMSRRKRVQQLLKHAEFSSQLNEICQTRCDSVNNDQPLIRTQVALAGLQTIGSVGTVMPIADLGSNTTYGTEEKIARNKLACLYRLVDLFHWSQGIYNHITYRVSKKTSDVDAEILINPFGLLYSEITASSLLKISLDGKILDSGSTNLGVNQAAYVLHSAIHAHRPDIRCVLHLHTPSVTAVSSMKCGLLPLSQEAMIVGTPAYHDYQGIVSDENERISIVEDLGNKKIMLLRNHGFVACGETLEETLHLAFHLIIACETQLRLGNIDLNQIVLPSDVALSKAFTTAQSGGGGVNKSDRSESRWSIGELEWEAWMRVLDSAGFYTGHVYKNQSLKFRYKQTLNTTTRLLDIATPPAARGIGCKKNAYAVDTMSKCSQMREKLGKANWLNNGETIKANSLTQNSSSIHMSKSSECCAAHIDVNEFKEKQRQMKMNRQLGQTTAGPTSQHLLDVIQTHDPQTAKQNENTPPYIIQTSSKAIIEKRYRDHAQVCYQIYTTNPFNCKQDEDVENYVRTFASKPMTSTEGNKTATDDNKLITTSIPSRSKSVEFSATPRIKPVGELNGSNKNRLDEELTADDGELKTRYESAMQVDPMSPIKGAGKMSSQRIVTLEGKSRLPARVHEVVVDCGAIVHSVQTVSVSGDSIQLSPVIKSFSTCEGTVNNTWNTLKKLEKICDRSHERNTVIEQSIPQVSDVCHTLVNIDRYSNTVAALSESI